MASSVFLSRHALLPHAYGAYGTYGLANGASGQVQGFQYELGEVKTGSVKVDNDAVGRLGSLQEPGKLP